MSFNKSELTNRINDVLASLRPFFEADGGDMKLVDITDKGVAQIQLLGSCSDCSMSQMTLKAGVEEALKKAAPEIIGVEAVILEA